jgi:hypothetical protein
MPTDRYRPPLVGSMPDISRALATGRLTDAFRLLREHMDDAAARRALAALMDTDPRTVRVAGAIS